MRLRFAPSPTGPLHIGGVRTALYNYLLAQKMGGDFILRIEDTDQGRFVPGAEAYILDALRWLGITFDEGPQQGGEYGPYRQSERKAIYAQYVQKLIDNGSAYISFDTPEELSQMRENWVAKGVHSPKYDFKTRTTMRNALTLSATEVQSMLDDKVDYVIRLKVDPDHLVHIQDTVRGTVTFNTSELDDKVLLKSDGMPTYHLANIIDDHLMKITHVIRGEEWLPSTAHHVLLYRAFGWEETMPIFAHLPLILKPNGKGKLSKRDGSKLGIPVFPIAWQGAEEEDNFLGFKEFGFLPAAVLNFLAFLGWNPGTEEELFDMDSLIKAFEPKNIGKSGARFDFEKAKWFNHQYIARLSDSELADLIRPIFLEAGHEVSESRLHDIASLMKDRIESLNEVTKKASFLVQDYPTYDTKQLKKKWSDNSQSILSEVKDLLSSIDALMASDIEPVFKEWINESGLGFGKVMPILRLALCGSLQGPDLFRVMQILRKQAVISRLEHALKQFPTMATG